MDIYKLNDINATVGTGADFENFKDVIDWVFFNYPYKKALGMFSCNGIQDVSEAVTNGKGQFDEEAAKGLCMDGLDGEDIDDENPKVEWGDQMYCRQAGK